MEASKRAVKDFLSKSGSNDTTVHEKVAPAVTHETHKPTQHENVTTAVDKEVHQDHYHTSVQPVVDKVVKPEQHTHNLVPVEHRSVDHGDSKDVDSRLRTEAAKFKDEKVVHDTKHTHSTAGAVGGEHVHHHVHENIQPVVQREVVQPSVVHTTVPVHETHHNAAQHHSTTSLPPVTMDEFSKSGGALKGREERTDAFQGEPKSIGGALSSNATGHHSHSGQHGVTESGITGDRSSGLTGNRTSDLTSGTGQRDTNTLRDSTMASGTTGAAGASSIPANMSTGTTNTSSKLTDKLDPRKDANGDGKKGIFS